MTVMSFPCRRFIGHPVDIIYGKELKSAKSSWLLEMLCSHLGLWNCFISSDDKQPTA